ncbi:MAG: prepilin-type N-terminal cleavage/methylation domain-containing protein [Candidatus Peribacteria bacterium]|nr:MAG: prepilin-type N-terminal cleavage/methylation domain-containing protein [Candidatus Peribacteria bacterium]
MRRKGFTLVELLIVIVVFSILVTVLFRTYNTIMRLSVRSEFQKNIQTDVLFVNQVMHNLADTYTIDFEAYGDEEIDSNGVVHTLKLIEMNDPTHTVTLSYNEGCYQ